MNASRESQFTDPQDVYDNYLGEMAAEDVPGSKVFFARGLLSDVVHFKKELRMPHVQYYVKEQLANFKVVAAKNKGTEVVLYVANNRTAIAAGGTAIVGLGALHFFRKRGR